MSACLTSAILSSNLDVVVSVRKPATSPNLWERWQLLAADPDVDPLDVIRASGEYQRYFAAVERQAVRAAKANGTSWELIGEALGTSRQAVWQRYRKVVTDARANPRSFVTWLKHETEELVPPPARS